MPYVDPRSPYCQGAVERTQFDPSRIRLNRRVIINRSSTNIQAIFSETLPQLSNVLKNVAILDDLPGLLLSAELFDPPELAAIVHAKGFQKTEHVNELLWNVNGRRVPDDVTKFLDVICNLPKFPRAAQEIVDILNEKDSTVATFLPEGKRQNTTPSVKRKLIDEDKDENKENGSCHKAPVRIASDRKRLKRLLRPANNHPVQNEALFQQTEPSGIVSPSRDSSVINGNDKRNEDTSNNSMQAPLVAQEDSEGQSYSEVTSFLGTSQKNKTDSSVCHIVVDPKSNVNWRPKTFPTPGSILRLKGRNWIAVIFFGLVAVVVIYLLLGNNSLKDAQSSHTLNQTTQSILTSPSPTTTRRGLKYEVAETRKGSRYDYRFKPYKGKNGTGRFW